MRISPIIEVSPYGKMLHISEINVLLPATYDKFPGHWSANPPATRIAGPDTTGGYRAPTEEQVGRGDSGGGGGGGAGGDSRQ
jgi:hypothetical protein